MCVFSEVFVKRDGSLYKEGDVMYRLRLADTLEMIAADDGVWSMYNGSLAHRLLQDLHDIGDLNCLTTFYHKHFVAQWPSG